MDSEYFRYLMNKKRVSTVELAKQLGVSRSQMNYKIKNGVFGIEDIKIISKLFDMKFEQIFG
jgi:predicted DNA binding protein